MSAGRYFDDETLKAYLADTLPPGEMSRIERELRGSAELRERLEEVRQNRTENAGLHTLGAIWRRGRISCPSREQLGSYLLDALDPEYAQYIKFHIVTLGCVYCQANLADLNDKAQRASAQVQTRHRRIFHSSRHLLSGEE